MPTAPGPLVLDHVAVGYPSGFSMDGLTFSAAPGEVVGVIGPNGGGKSTMLRAIAGVLAAREGSITLGGRDLADHPGRVAFVPQREDVKWDFPTSAFEAVLMARTRDIGWFRRPRHDDRRIAAAALERLGLAGMGDRHISEFSGGQQQRIFLARALAQQPFVVVLDEPFTGVDTENRRVLHDVIRQFAREGMVTLIATHDLDEVTEMCSSLCCINHGLVAFGPTAETYTPETIRATFGGQVAVFA